MEAVCNSFNDNNICVAEAGTGVGKSYAYLIPAFLWAERNHERIVISTGTINLQHQLLEKDIPEIKKLLDSKLKAVLVKGRQNYICLRKFNERKNEAELFDDQDEFYTIEKWTQVTETGDRSDLTFMPKRELWSEIASDSETCLGLYCPYREKCFVLRNRKEAAGADILVVNHHLLYSDLYARSQGASLNGTSILPFYSRVIFDEAHNMESSATSFFSESLTKRGIQAALNRIFRRMRTRTYGLYKFWLQYSQKDSLLEEIPQHIQTVIDDADLLEKIIHANIPDHTSVVDINTDINIDRIGILDALAKVKCSLIKIFNDIEEIYDELVRLPEDQVKDSGHQIYETALVKNKINTLIEFCNSFADTSDSYVAWIEKRKNSVLNITPVSVADILCSTIFEKLTNVVLVSATLSINRNFNYYFRRVGLNLAERPIRSDIFASPFDYKRNVLLSVPTDLPEPNDPHYADVLTDLIRDMILISEGKALVLFTSYNMLNTVYDLVKDDFANAGIVLYRQGDGDNKILLENFKANINSVLFATDSFWEGVDSPGETLSLLILCRLPFKVPSDPVIKARMDLIEKQGGNSFMDYSLPEAVIKLRQGFGRLIRRKSDRGVVLITDSRIVNKFYGKIFLSSLPVTMRNFTVKDRIGEPIESFLYSP
ncbi:MAG: hypothetical protein MJ215_07695 [Spirochaetia bacterium]|nr:hypothetical protein [Spirochaetia bacterium]